MPENTDDLAQFRNHGRVLRDAVAKAVRPWLVATVSRRGIDVDPVVSALVERVAVDVEASIDELVNADINAPLSGPLERIRRAVAPVNQLLETRGVQKPVRNAMDAQMRPDDVYELGPMTFRDLGDDVHDAGITWGAAKAHLHLKRRQ